MPEIIKLENLIQEITNHPRYQDSLKRSNPAVIGIAGGSGSGKTHISNLIIQNFNGKPWFMDDYYKGAESTSDGNYDHPGAVDIDLLSDHIKILKEGKAIKKPVYDFTMHKRIKYEDYQPSKLIVLDGLFSLFGELIADLNLAIYVDASEEVRYARRLERDIAERGRTPESVLEQWNQTVKPMHDRFIAWQKSNADLIVVNE